MPNRKVYGKQKDSMAKQLYDEHSLTVPSSKSDCSLQQCGCGEGADGMDGWCGCRWGAAQKGYTKNAILDRARSCAIAERWFLNSAL